MKGNLRIVSVNIVPVPRTSDESSPFTPNTSPNVEYGSNTHVFIVRCQRIGDPALEVTFVAAGLRRGILSAVRHICSREVSQRPTTPFSHISMQMRAVGHKWSCWTARIQTCSKRTIIGVVRGPDKSNPTEFAVGHRQWPESKEHTGLILSNQKIKPNGQKLVEYLVGEVVILTNGPD
jgi:hypothetical protein